MAKKKVKLWSDALIREASEQFRFQEERGFRRVDELDQHGAKVEYRGERLTLSLSHGDYREFIFSSEIAYAKYPRRNPLPLWLVFEALGLDASQIKWETMVGEERLRTLVAATAEAVRTHWDMIAREPTQNLYDDVKRISERYARKLRR